VEQLGNVKKLVDVVKRYVTELYNYYIPPFTVNPVKLSESEVLSVVNDIQRKTKTNNNWLRLDGDYYTVDSETFRKIIEWDWTDTRKYIVDLFDCDKFAIYFKSRIAIEFKINAIAVILDYSSGHAYNIVILKDANQVKWYIYEPQTDELFTYEQRDTRFYAMRDFYILL
jgi:hypothetical protein